MLVLVHGCGGCDRCGSAIGIIIDDAVVVVDAVQFAPAPAAAYAEQRRRTTPRGARSAPRAPRAPQNAFEHRMIFRTHHFGK